MADKTQQVADEDLANLRASVTEANTKAAQATQTAAAATDENAKLKAALGDAQAQRVAADELAATNALAAAESEAAAQERNIAEAGAKQDWAALAKAQRVLASTQTKIDAWTRQQANIQNWKKTQIARAQRPQPKPQEQQTQTDPLAQYTPKTQEWLRAHPDVYKDPKKMARAVAAHYDAEADGVATDTPEYFKRLEDHLGIGATGADTSGALSEAAEAVEVDTNRTVEVQEQQPTQRASTAAVAVAPSRRTPTTSNAKLTDSAGRVRLSVSQQEAARISWPHLKPDEAYKEYAVNLVKLSQEGRLNP